MGGCKSKPDSAPPDVAGTLAVRTNFTRKEISCWYRGFMTDCPGGVLDHEGLAQMLKQYFPRGNPEKFCSIIFKLFDSNQDGHIDFCEFVTALSTSSRGTLEERLEWSFRMYDLDGDGYISQDELHVVVGAIYAMVGSSFELAEDENTPEKKCMKMFAMMDLKEEGRISKKEFVEVSKSEPAIVQALCLYDSMNSHTVAM